MKTEKTPAAAILAETEYLTAGDFLAEPPAPLVRDVAVFGMGKPVHIEGIETSEQRNAIVAKFLLHLKTNEKGGLTRVLGYKPTENQIFHAAFAEACVTAPKMPIMDWLKIGHKRFRELQQIGVQCLICSREQSDPDDVTILDGVDAAESEIEHGGGTDGPLA